MEFKYPNSKKLYLTVEISQLLYRHNCTYNEANEILKLTTDEIQQQIEDFDCDKDCVIQSMNHVEPYCYLPVNNLW